MITDFSDEEIKRFKEIIKKYNLVADDDDIEWLRSARQETRIETAQKFLFCYKKLLNLSNSLTLPSDKIKLQNFINIGKYDGLHGDLDKLPGANYKQIFKTRINEIVDQNLSHMEQVKMFYCLIAEEDELKMLESTSKDSIDWD